MSDEKIQDKFGYSPDVGKFVVRDRIVYTENGSVLGVDKCFRSLPSEPGSHENYADWTDEKRAEVKAKHDQVAADYKLVLKQKIESRHQLVARAKTKLSEEEFEAVREQGCMEGRGYDY